MFHVFDDLLALNRDANIPLSPTYKSIVGSQLLGPLSYSTPMMYGTAETLFSSRKMIAFNLLQNSVDEAKGAARIAIIANKYAPPGLKDKMRRHIGEEIKHSRLFLNLLPLTGFSLVEDGGGATNGELDKVLEFDDDLRAFICRVHSIEVRSWIMLRTYLDVLEDLDDSGLEPITPVLQGILKDEISHVLYTGRQVDEWLTEDPAFAETFDGCLAHTNRETWRDMANMSDYLAKHYEWALVSA